MIMDGEFEEAFRPVATEIGFLAREWNGLHDCFAQIFGQIVGPANVNIPQAVWNSATSDRVQRDMLRAAIHAWGAFDQDETEIFNEIKWLLDESNKLSDKRNNAIHAPLAVAKNSQTLQLRVVPHTFGKHPQAIRLKDKDILVEFRTYRAQAKVLKQHAQHVWHHMRRKETWPLPQRPKLPTSISKSSKPKEGRQK